MQNGDFYNSLVWEERKTVFNQHLQEVLNKNIVRFEERYDFPGQKSVYLEITYSPVMKDQKVIGIILCGEETTDRFLAKETILKSEQKYRELVETSIDLIWTIDKTGTLVFVNNAAKDIMGMLPEEIIGKKFIDFVGPSDKERVNQHIYDALLSTSQYNNYESTIITKDGTLVNVITHAVVNHDERSGNTWLTGTSRDISQRVRAEKELSTKNDQLRQLSSYLQTIREEERTHIAREIHDELGQQLTGLKMDLAFMNRRFGDQNIEISVKLTEMMMLVDETIRSVRQISSDLRPGILDDLGLIPAIEWQCNEFEKRTKIKCVFNNQVNEIAIGTETATGVFRILQESFTNIARHSHAGEVVVEMKFVDQNIVLTITDNGKGFVKEHSTPKSTLGLIGMEERAAMLNGLLTITSSIKKGTQVQLTFPALKPETAQL